MYDFNSVITRKQILERFSEEEIFSYIIKDSVSLDRKYCSPCRYDLHAGCFFIIGKYGNLVFCDFANPTQNIYDCFQLYSKTFNINEKFVYDHIWFNVTSELYSNKILLSKAIKTKKQIKNTIIRISAKNWERNEIDFWKQYGITVKQLNEDKVIPLKAVWIESKDKSYSFKISKIGFAYTDFKNNRKKIYQPYNTYDKWFTNCNANDIGCIDQLINSGYNLIITKSYKDCRVIRNLGYNCIWFQNEGMCPSANILEPLLKRFNKVYVFYDNDKTGIEASEKIKNILLKYNENIYAFHLPEQLYKKGIKDSSDFVKSLSYNNLNNFIKSKIETK